MIPIGESAFSVFDLATLVAGPHEIALSTAAEDRITKARKIVEAYAAGNEPVYGLNTGLGGNLEFRIDKEAIRDFQEQIIVGRNIGVGEPLPQAICRAALLARIIGMATGGSGVSRATLGLLIEMFNRGVTPVIPARGSISAADIGLSGHIAAVMIGHGSAWFAGERLAGADALQRAGLAPARLEAKDGMALCNHSAPSAAHAALTLVELGRSLALAAAIAALAFESYGANPRIFDARLNAARPAAGQIEAGNLFDALLAGSSIHDNPGRIQDALSFRCIAPVMGTMFNTFAMARCEVEIEINSATDSPLVLIEDRLMLSAPNFHTPTIALALDTISIAMVHLAAMSAQRIIKLMNPALSGLAKYLSPIGGASAGYVSLQKTIAGLHAEIRLSATPASLDAMPVSDSVEDHAPLTLLTSRKLATQLVPFKLLLAVEALVAAQAVDLRTGLRLSEPGGALYRAIRQQVPMLTRDREPGKDVMAVAELLETPSVVDAILGNMAGLGLPILA